MIKRFQNYIETSDWDELGDDVWKYLDWFCWAMMAISVLYFGGGYLQAWMEGRIG